MESTVAKKKSPFQKAQATVLDALRRFETAVMEMVGESETTEKAGKLRSRKTNKRKTTKRRG
jgi:hypothetical protein